MICYRDMTFCSVGDQCANRFGCPRWFTPADAHKARQWWGKDDPPIGYSDFSETCPQWEKASPK